MSRKYSFHVSTSKSFPQTLQNPLLLRNFHMNRPNESGILLVCTRTHASVSIIPYGHKHHSPKHSCILGWMTRAETITLIKQLTYFTYIIPCFSCFLPLTPWSYPQLNSQYIFLRTSSLLECLQFIHSTKKCILCLVDTQRRTRLDPCAWKPQARPRSLSSSVRLRIRLYFSASGSHDLPRSKDFLPAKFPVFISFFFLHFWHQVPPVMKPSPRDSPCLVSHSSPTHGIIFTYFTTNHVPVTFPQGSDTLFLAGQALNAGCTYLLY